MSGKRTQPPSVTIKYVKGLLVEFIPPANVLGAGMKEREGGVIDFKFESGKSKPDNVTLYKNR